jgi:hypothetical protein
MQKKFWSRDLKTERERSRLKQQGRKYYNGSADGDCTESAQIRVQRRAFVNMVVNFWGSLNAGSFLTG